MEISAERLDEPKKKFWLVLSQLISTSCCCCNCLHCMRGGHDFGNLLMDFPSPKSSSKIPQALTFAMSKFRTKLFYYITEGRSLIGYFNAIFGSLNIERCTRFVQYTGKSSTSREYNKAARKLQNVSRELRLFQYLQFYSNFG